MSTARPKTAGAARLAENRYVARIAPECLDVHAHPLKGGNNVEHAHAAEIRDTDLTVYIHSPYVLNVATTNNRIRIPSRKLLDHYLIDAFGTLPLFVSTWMGAIGT